MSVSGLATGPEARNTCASRFTGVVDRRYFWIATISPLFDSTDEFQIRLTSACRSCERAEP